MSEFIGDSTEFDGQALFDQEFIEQTPLHGVAEYDERTRILSALLESISTDLPDSDFYENELAEEIMEASRLFGVVCLSIHRAYGSDVAQACIASLLKSEDIKRIDQLRKLTGSDVFEYFKEGQLEDFTSNVYENMDSEEEIEEIMCEIFKRGLHSDLEMFVIEVEKLRGKALLEEETTLRGRLRSWGRAAKGTEVRCFVAGATGAALGSIVIQQFFKK